MHRQCNDCFWWSTKSKKCKNENKSLRCSGFDSINVCHSEFSKHGKKEIVGKV